MRREIRWLALDLEGFGTWRAPARFRFPEGLGVLALPNEGGKSTMVAGLRAVLFGLSGESDPLRDGIGRYRSWNHSGACKGQLDLRAGDRRIRIQRDFISHATLVSEIDDSGTAERSLFEGSANPAGKTAKRSEYAEVLKDLLADLADEDLFAATFLVQQPILPAGEMTEALRRLVSGVGRVGGNEARAALFEEVKALTLATGDRGLIAPGSKRPTNQRTDGAIEKLEQEIVSLERMRTDAAGDFDRLVRLEKDLTAARETERRAAEEQTHAQADHKQIESYRELLTAHEAARAASDDLNRALDNHDARSEEARVCRQRLSEEFGDLADAPGDLEQRLEATKGLESERASLQASMTDRRQSIDRSAQTVAGLRAALPIQLDDASIEEPVGWMARTRETAKRWQRAVARFLEAENKRKEPAAARAGLATIAVLPSEVIDSLARLPESLKDLEDRERMAAELDRSQRSRLQELERRREEIGKHYACIEGIDSAYFLSVLEKRSAQHRKIKSLVAEIEGLREGRRSLGGRRWKRAILIGLPVALLVGAAAFAGQLPPVVAIAASLTVLTCAILLLTRPPREAQRRIRRIAACEHEISEVRDAFRIEFIPSGPWLPDDEGLSDRAQKLFAQRDEEAALLAAAEKELPNPETLEQTERTRTESRAAIERLEQQARQIEEATGRPAPEAVSEYRRLSALLEDVETERQSAWRELVGSNGPELAGDKEEVDPLDVPLTALAEPWLALTDLSRALDLQPLTLRGLYARLCEMDSDRWDAWEKSARAYVDGLKGQAHAGAEMTTLEEKLRGIEAAVRSAREEIGTTRLAHSENSLEKLRERLRVRDDLAKRSAEAERAVENALSTARDGPYADREALAKAHQQQDERRRDRQSDIDETLRKSELVRSYAAENPIGQDRIRREVASRAEEADASWRDAQQKVHQAKAALDAWKPPEAVNLAALELTIDRARYDLTLLRERCDAAERAWFLMEKAIAEFQSSHREGLETRLDERFRRITGRQRRRVRVGDDLLVTLLEDGISSIDHQLSQGARDQLAFCLRLAVADLVAGDLVLPLILDDPFVHSDAERIERIREALEEAAHERQLILLTQEERLSGWGAAITREAVDTLSG